MNWVKAKKQYKQYLQSKKWKLLREQAFTFHGRRCGLCGSKFNLQVHHLTYKNIFKETMADLRVICDTCHKKAHRGKQYESKKIDSDTVTFYPNRHRLV